MNFDKISRHDSFNISDFFFFLYGNININICINMSLQNSEEKNVWVHNGNPTHDFPEYRLEFSNHLDLLKGQSMSC